MTRIPVKLSMCSLLMALAVIVGAVPLAYCQVQAGTPIGPGVGGQVHAIAFDPENPDVIYAGGDVCGVYRYSIAAGQWTPWSSGLGFGDLNWSYYVDDILVLRSVDGVPLGMCGVYAATWGGVYFRPDDQTQWRCLTSNATYSGGYAVGYHFGGPMRVPFSCLAYDSKTQILYAGAGHGRTAADPNTRYVNFYPTSCGTPVLRCAGEYSMWECDLSGSATPPQFQSVPNTDNGKVRQIAIADYIDGSQTPRHEILYACDNGLWIVGDVAPLWSADTTNKVLPFNAAIHSVDPWGVVVGSDATCYIATYDVSGALQSGVWKYPLATRPRTAITPAWDPVGSPNDYVWPHVELPDTLTWGRALYNSAGDFTDLSIVLNEDGRGDALYVGSGADGASYPAYLRFGSYNYNGTARQGWAHVHRKECPPGGGLGYEMGCEMVVADWRHGPIRSIPMTAEDVGWHAFDISMRALTPFAVNRTADSIMVAVDYAVPMLTVNGGTSWQNLYCTGNDATGWSSRGLNLLCPGSSTFLPTGELVIGALDYGVFVGATSANTSFLPLHEGDWSKEPDWPSAVDVEVMVRSGVREYYMVDSTPDKPSLTHREWSAIRMWTGDRWESISGDLWGAFERTSATTRIAIQDIVFPDEDRVIAAVGLDVGPADAKDPTLHFYICEGRRPATGTNWTWQKRTNVDSLVAETEQTRMVNRICLVPGTPLLMLATKLKGDSAGGLYPVNLTSWQMGAAWFSGGDATTALGRLGENVTAVAADRLGRYLYAGCGGGDLPSYSGRGGLVRFPITSGTPGAAEILAGYDGLTPDAGDVFHVSGVNNFIGMTHGTTQDWEFCTRVNDIVIDPNNPLVAYVAVGAGNLPFYHAKFGAWRVKGTAWDQIWGANETGSGAKTVGISPTDNSTLYVGSVGQEFFKAEIVPSLPPIVSLSAEYPALAATGAAMAHAIGVRVNPVQGTTIQAVTADLSPWGGLANVALLDNGVSPDLEAGDGIYTSGRVAANFVGAGTAAIKVFAQASDGGYTQSNVTVTVVASATAPTITPQAVYPLRAGSTDASRVLAVQVSTPAATTRVTADIAGLGGTGRVRLRDDGKGDDVKALDNIYTSAPFVAGMATAGSYSTTVTAAPMTGTPVSQLVAVEAVASAAKFSDVSNSTGALKEILTEVPYAAVYFKSEPGNPSSDDLMVVTFDSSPSDSTRAPVVLRRYGYTGGAPVFQNKTWDWIGLGGLPKGGRGVCCADYDNDGDNDLFICNPYYGGKLYENRLPVGFVDVTQEVFGEHAGDLAQAINASWADYNRDGFVDLFVAGTNYFGSVRHIQTSSASFASGSILYSHWVFRNVNGVAMDKTSYGESSSMNLILSSCWLDLDNDGDQDLVYTRFIGGAIAVMENIGYSLAWNDNGLVPSWGIAQGYPDAVFGANSVSVIDYDHNEFPDLLVTYATHDGNPKSKILHNNYDPTNPNLTKTFTPIELTAGTEWSGATVADFDNNGQDDILLHPKAAGVQPALLMADGYSSTTAPNYRDLGYTLGLREGETGGGLAADFDKDGNVDLFMGRANAKAFLYRSDMQAATANHWVGVSLTSLGNSNKSLIGTSVIVIAPDGRRWTKVVDGGSGRGGQSSNQLRFGLGDATGNVTVTVKYPSGEVDSSNAVLVGSVWNAVEDQVPTLKPGTKADLEPDYDIELQPGVSDWIFKWRTTNNKGDMTRDEVEVQNYMHYEPDGNCGVGIADTSPRILQWGNADVEFHVHWDGLMWQHEVRWMALPCGMNCEYRFRVRSGLGGQWSAWSGLRTMTTTTFCVADPDVPMQQ